MITEAISAKLLDEILSTLFEKVKNTGVNIYAKLANPIELNFPQEDVNKIIKEAFENARKCNYLKDIDKEELELLLSDNAELIYSWIIDDQQFNSELLRLQSDEHKKNILLFCNRFFILYE